MGHLARFLAAQKAKADAEGGSVGFVGTSGVISPDFSGPEGVAEGGSVGFVGTSGVLGGEFRAGVTTIEEGSMHPLNHSFNYIPLTSPVDSPPNSTAYDPEAPYKTYETPGSGTVHVAAALNSGGYDPETPYKTYETPPSGVSWPPRDPRLADWPIPVRQLWAALVVVQEAAGLGWREAEALAFRETLARVEAGELGPKSEPAPPARPSAPAPTSARRRPEPAGMFPN